MEGSSHAAAMDPRRKLLLEPPEAEHRAALAVNADIKDSYRKLAAAWLRLARNVEFTEKLDATLSGQDE